MPRDESIQLRDMDGPRLADPMHDARGVIADEEERVRRETRPARRLLIAGILIVLSGVLFFVVTPTLLGVWLPPLILGLTFAVIVVGSIVSGAAERRVLGIDDDPNAPLMPIDGDATDRLALPGVQADRHDEGRAIGCCQGPRPMRCFKPKSDGRTLDEPGS